MNQKRSIVYRKPNGDHGIIYDGNVVPDDREWTMWSPQVIPEDTIEVIRKIENNDQKEVNKILSSYLP